MVFRHGTLLFFDFQCALVVCCCYGFGVTWLFSSTRLLCLFGSGDSPIAVVVYIKFTLIRGALSGMSVCIWIKKLAYIVEWCAKRMWRHSDGKKPIQALSKSDNSLLICESSQRHSMRMGRVGGCVGKRLLAMLCMLPHTLYAYNVSILGKKAKEMKKKRYEFVFFFFFFV